MRPQTYEITLAGQAGMTLRAESDDCEITVGSDNSATSVRPSLAKIMRITGSDGILAASATACPAGS